MHSLAERLDAALRLAGVGIAGVSLGDPREKGTWLVAPAELQAQAQPIIDAFRADDPSFAKQDADEEADALAMSPVVGALLTVLCERFAFSGEPADVKSLRDRMKALMAADLIDG